MQSRWLSRLDASIMDSINQGVSSGEVMMRVPKWLGRLLHAHVGCTNLVSLSGVASESVLILGASSHQGVTLAHFAWRSRPWNEFDRTKIMDINGVTPYPPIDFALLLPGND